jgi:hypothetical protein
MPSKNPAKNRRARISKNRPPTSSVLLLYDRLATLRISSGEDGMTEHAVPDTAPSTADLFEIIRTIRSMRRLKRVPNELIRKILEAGVCAPSGGNMQRGGFW